MREGGLPGAAPVTAPQACRQPPSRCTHQLGYHPHPPNQPATGRVGHLTFEHNKPATFKHPIYSLMGDFKLFFEVLTLQRPF